MFWKSSEVGQHIARVAAAADEPEEFSRRAAQSAATLGRKAIRKSRPYFWSPPRKPDELQGRFEGLGEWMAVCQAAIFEIWFHLGKVALADLRRVAFGLYDWTQANATDILCRLARDGLETAQTAEQIAKALPAWRYEQVMRVCRSVAELAARSPVLQDAYEQIIDEYRSRDPIDGFELIAAAVKFSRERMKHRYSDFLRGLSDGIGLEGRTAYDDGHVVPTGDGKGITARSGPTYPQLEDFHKIRAAILLHELQPDDADITTRLERWASDHPDDGVRSQLRKILSTPARGPV